MSEDRKRYGFWAFAADNPIMIIILMVIFLGLVAIMCGYREGFASVLTGLFGFMKKDDTDRRLEEKALEVKKIEAGNRILEDAVPMAWARHDEEVEDNVQSAKAYCDELDIDELVDLKLYLSLACGRKTMSADMQDAAWCFGCDMLLHILGDSKAEALPVLLGAVAANPALQNLRDQVPEFDSAAFLPCPPQTSFLDQIQEQKKQSQHFFTTYIKK